MKNALQLSLDFGPVETALEAKAANDATGQPSTLKLRDVADVFYRSKPWRRARAAVLAKFGARCQTCGATPADGVRIDVDHIQRRSTHPHLALYLPNLRPLCDACHEAKTYRERLALPLYVTQVYRTKRKL